jgi:hypothetical protein
VSDAGVTHGGDVAPAEPRSLSEVDFELVESLHQDLAVAYGQIRRHRFRRLSPARLYVAAHFDRQKRRLRNVYQSLLPEASNEPHKHEWLLKRVGDMTTQTTAVKAFSLARKATGFATWILTPTIGLAGIGSLAHATLDSCFCHVVRWAPFVLTASLLWVGYDGLSGHPGTARSSGTWSLGSPPRAYGSGPSTS